VSLISPSPGYAEDVSVILEQSIAYYERGEFRKATRDLKRLVDELRDRPANQERRQILFRANLYLGLSYLGMGNQKLAKDFFRDAVLVSPETRIDPELFSPKVISLYNEVLEQTLAILVIESNIAGADIFLRNERKGAAPAEIRNLLPGEYTVRVVAGSQEAAKDVLLESGKVTTLVADFENIGSLFVTSNPPSANVSLENMAGGITPFSTQVPSGEYAIIVSKEGFLESRKQVFVHEHDTQKIHFDLVPTACSLGISSDPTSANIYLDNIHKGRTPLRIEGVSGGVHTIKIEKEGYQTIQEPLDVNQQFTEKTYYLLPCTGHLLVETDPSGAAVTIDGKNAGVTPLHLNELPVKEHSMQLEKKGYVTKTRTVNIVENELSRIKEILLELDSAPPVITFVPVEKAIMENKNFVKVKVADNKGVREVFLILTVADWRYANKIKMHENTKGVYEALLPNTLLKETTMKYYISACDMHNNCATEGSKESPFYLEVESVEPYTEGYILHIERDRDYDIRRLTVSVGAEDGVRKGDEYVVFRAGNALKDPMTNEILQIEEKLVGTIEIIELMPRTSYAEVDDTFVSMKANDRIRKIASAPKGLVTEGSYSNKIILRWIPNTEPEVKGYRIFRSSQAQGAYRQIGRTRGRDNTVYKDDDDMSPGVTYYYRVTAYNILDAESEMSKPLQATTTKVR
jgi:hypothetical protein